MSVASIISEISTNVPALGSVVEACRSGSEPSVDTSAELVSLLGTAIAPANVFPSTLQETPDFPNAVYNLVKAMALSLEGRQLAHTDMYVVSIRAKTFEELVVALDQVRTDFRASSHAIEVLDVLTDWDYDHDSYRVNMQVAFTTPATCGAMITLPAAMVYEVEQAAEPPTLTSRCLRQRVVTYYAVVIMTTGADLETLRQSVYDAVLGYQEDANHEPIWFVDGAPVANDGGLTMWRSVFSDAELISPLIHT